MVPTLIENC